MPAVACLIGILIGSVPTTDLLGRRWGVDLRTSGSGNPGTNNALRLGGRGLAVTVLLAELIKGAAAVWAGRAVAGDPGGALAAIGAITGNVYNPWFHFRGGKGLAITGGTLLAGWPAIMPVLAIVIGTSAKLFRRSGPAALVTFAVYVATALIGWFVDVPTGWGLKSTPWLTVMAAGSVAVMLAKHGADAITRAAPDPSRQ